MAAEQNTFELLARHLMNALRPLASLGSVGEYRQFMDRLGYRVNTPPPSFTSLSLSANTAAGKVDVTAEGLPIKEALDLLSLVKGLFDAIQNLKGSPPPELSAADQAAFSAEIGTALVDLLLGDYLASAFPAAFNVLAILNVAGYTSLPATATRPASLRLHFNWPELPKFLSDASGLPARTYQWGTPNFTVGLLLYHLSNLFLGLRFPVAMRMPDLDILGGYLGQSDYDPSDPTDLSLVVPFYSLNTDGKKIQAFFQVHALPASGRSLPGVVFEPNIPAEFPLEIQLHPKVKLRLRPGTNGPLFGVVLRPNDASVKYPLAPATSPSPGGLGIAFDFNPGSPTVLLGDPGSSRLEFASAGAELAAEFVNGAWSIVQTFNLNGFQFVFDPGEGDGFLRFLIGGDKTTIALPLALRWGQDGIRLGGSGSFDIVIHPHITIGPASIDDIDFRFYVPDGPKPRIRLEIGAGITGSIGPVSFFLQGVGLRADAIFQPGNAGPIDLTFGFKPPTGVGLSIDGGGFRGGGALGFDPDKGEYFGILELTFAEIVSVRAVGILSTKLPDGSDTFSLLIIIATEFVPIQLSYGFTLLGVGGLLGLNRTYNQDTIQAGIGDGTLSSILFPTDVVANAPRIISDLRRIFPAQDGSFLMGPMGKLGYGTPTLASIEIGLFLRIPDPGFIILGIVRVQLPAEDFGTIYIQVNFVGSVDFEKGQLQFDAELVNSRVLIDPITGSLSLRIYWGGEPNFLLSAGGFHPAYTPPPMNLRPMARIGFVVVAGIPMVRAEIYLAITSNSVQFGARVEVIYGISYFNVFGFVSLDVLIQFNPFLFIAEITAMFGVRSGSDVLFAIRVTGTLKGPTPWNLRGEASFEIGFIVKVRISADFEVTSGESRNTLLPTIDVIEEIRKAVDNIGNWRAVLPAGSNQHVSLRDLPGVGDALVLHPFGALEINQKISPLDIPIQRFGSSRPDRGTIFSLASVQINKAVVTTVPTTEQFAPAQFFDLSDADRLSRPSFARYDSGLVIGTDNAPQTDFRRGRESRYEVIYLPEHHPVRLFFKLAASLFIAFARGGAAAQSPLSQERRSPSPIAAEHVRLAAEQYAVVSTLNMTLHAPSLIFANATAADQAVASLISTSPELTGAIQVVPSVHIRTAA